MIKDCHTHREAADAVVNLPLFGRPESGLKYSAGIHPWDIDRAVERVWTWLEEMAARPEVVAIGEAGFDKLRGGAAERQREVFDRQAALAERYGKPLIIHMVRSQQQIMEAIKRLRPTVPWIIHGFRGGSEQARQLMAAYENLYLSFGPRFNAEALRVTPAERIMTETDDDPAARIDEVRRAVAQIKGREAEGIGRVFG